LLTARDAQRTPGGRFRIAPEVFRKRLRPGDSFAPRAITDPAVRSLLLPAEATLGRDLVESAEIRAKRERDYRICQRHRRPI